MGNLLEKNTTIHSLTIPSFTQHNIDWYHSIPFRSIFCLRYGKMQQVVGLYWNSLSCGLWFDVKVFNNMEAGRKRFCSSMKIVVLLPQCLTLHENHKVLLSKFSTNEPVVNLVVQFIPYLREFSISWLFLWNQLTKR